MSHIRFSFQPPDSVFRTGDISATENEHATETPGQSRFPMAKHTGKDIPIRDNGGNQIGMARVHEMSLRLGERGQQGIEVSLDIRFDNPLRTIDPFSLDGLHISLGDDPDPAWQEYQETYRQRHTSPLDTPAADNVVVLKPDASARTFTRDDSHGAEFRAAWTVIGPSRSTSGRFEVHDRRVVTEGPAVTAATLDELAESLLILSRLHPRTFTVSVSIPVAQELLKPDPEAASETSAQAIVRVTAEGLRIVPSTDSGDAEDADFVVTRNDPGLMEITNRRKKQTEAWAQGPEELRIVLGLLRKKVEPHDITVVLDRELAEQVIDR